MCGIAGLWNWFQSPERNRSVVHSMMEAMVHRGPDSQGAEWGKSWAVGHVRLSIVDVEGGRQPIFNEDNSLFIIGNNEIYNAAELKSQLYQKGHRFKTRSDTEVALHAYEQWGEAAFAKFNGMFALVIVDLKKQECVLVRDQMGIKPLHLLQHQNRFAFASEIKSLLQIPDYQAGPDFDAIHLFMNFRYVPNEQTLFKGVERVAPGSFVRLTKDGSITRKKFYNFPEEREEVPSYASSVGKLQELLKSSVSRHLVSDVPVASYLSGGIDSSTVSYLAAKEVKPLRTYCLGFGEPTDENQDALAVANYIGSKHSQLNIGDSPLDAYREILWHVEEPKVNLMQGYRLAEFTSREVKVALSGLGGDELFAGYVNNDILLPMTIFSRLTARKGSSSLAALQKIFSHPKFDFYFRAGELALNSLSPLHFYSILRNSFDHNKSLLNAIYEDAPSRWVNASTRALAPYYQENSKDPLNALLRLEARTKMVNDFLLTEDRVSMAHALEVRVPFLDRELVDFAFSLPSRYKYGVGQKKRILKEAIEGWLPPSVLQKKKWGFSVNPYLLFQKQLKGFAEEILTEKAVKDFGLFSWKWIQSVLSAPPDPKMRWHYFNIWVMAGFVLWNDRFFKNHGRIETSYRISA